MKSVLGDKFQPWRTGALLPPGWLLCTSNRTGVVERVINHVSGAQGGLVGVYQRHEYREERRRAIMAWGEHVMSIVSADKSPSNVVRFAASR